MKEKLKVNPSKISTSSFRQRNGVTTGTRYVVGGNLGRSITRPYRYPTRKSIVSPTTVKTLLDLVYEPVVIGAFIIAFCTVGSVYVLSQWYYKDFDPEPISTEIHVSKLTESPAVLASMDLSRLSSWEAESGWEAAVAAKPTQTESELGPYELTPEEAALLIEHFAETLPNPARESPHGLGPYPEIPPDYPRQNIWDDLEDLNDAASNELGRSSIDHELMHRVLIKLWNQGKKAEGAFLDSDNGRVYPMYKDTVYVRWKESENEDGTYDTYLSRYSCHPSLKDYRDSVGKGTQPSWIKVVAIEDGGIDPYSFLDLP